MEKEIVKKNEIVSILNNMRLKHLGVHINDIHNERVASGYVTKVDSNHMSLFLDSVPDIMPTKNTSITFEYNRHFYATSKTSVRIMNIPIKSLEIELPEKLLFHPLRKFTRVALPYDSMKLQILSAEEEVKNDSTFRKANIDELPPNLRKIYLEILEENPDMKKIVQMIGEELSRYTNRFKTNIFKDIKNLSPLEKVVQTYRKTFWISDTDNLNNYVHLGAKYNIIGYERYFEMVKKTLSPDVLEQIRNNYLSRNIASYCMIPVLIGESVAGVIEVSVPSDRAEYKKLTIYDIFYIKGLADILAEVVVKSKMNTVGKDTEFTVVDISMGGMLVNTKNIYITRTYKEGSLVKVELLINEQKFELSSRIVRYDYIPGSNGGLNVAFEFLSLDETIKAEIGKFIRNFLKIQLSSDTNKE